MISKPKQLIAILLRLTDSGYKPTNSHDAKPSNRDFLSKQQHVSRRSLFNVTIISE